MNLYDVFRDTARRQPDRPAILSATGGLSYGGLNEVIEVSGEALRAAGLRPGCCVGLHLPSGVDYITYNYAVWRCGGCVVPIPVELAAPEKQEICREIALDFVISPGRSPAEGDPVANLPGGQVIELPAVTLSPCHLVPLSSSDRRRANSATASACSSVSMEPGRSRRTRAMAFLAVMPLLTK